MKDSTLFWFMWVWYKFRGMKNMPFKLARTFTPKIRAELYRLWIADSKEDTELF